MEEDIEGARDPRAQASQPNFSQCDFEDHRACTVYIGYYVPGYRKKGHHRRKQHMRHGYYGDSESSHDVNKPPATPPSERVHFILGEEEDGSHEPHPLFSEMEELYQKGKELEWRETARWIKFEEDVEEGGNRWSKPHVATVSLHSLFELRSCILNGTILLDMDAHSLDEIADLVLDNMEQSNYIPSDSRSKIKEILLRPHRHQHEIRNEWMEKGARPFLIRSSTDAGKGSNKLGSHRTSASDGLLCENPDTSSNSQSFRSMLQSKANNSPDESASDASLHKSNQSLMKKIPPKAEASNILVGELDCLDKVVSCFVRLTDSCSLGDLTEVPVPTRFIFILLGPSGNTLRYHEIGRAMATLLSDEVFHGVAYKGKDRSDLLAAVDEFLDATTVLPPGVWDPRTRMEPPIQTLSQELRKIPEPKKETKEEPSGTNHSEDDTTFTCNIGLFQGLVSDISSRKFWNINEYKEALSLQCISSIAFLYFACIAQFTLSAHTLGLATNQKINMYKYFQAVIASGALFSIFGGQPLILLGSTGSIIAFDSILFKLCERHSVDYLAMRFGIGIWTSVYLLIFTAFNMASMARLITRFTGEIFAMLASTYFIYSAFNYVLQIGEQFPLKMGHSAFYPLCVCLSAEVLNASVSSEVECRSASGISTPIGCRYDPPMYVPNVFLMSVILFIGTFALIILFRSIKKTAFFPTKVRTAISDFAVLISLICMTLLDMYAGIATPKLQVPQEKVGLYWNEDTAESDWIMAITRDFSVWIAAFSVLPALLLTALILVDQETTSVIVNRKENKLKNGAGYHQDLMVLSLFIFTCSVVALPWFAASTILSMTHVDSLKKSSLSSTPGDKPKFFGVREQRVTHFCVYFIIGASQLFTTNVFQFMPMPILYGVFLFMGVNSLKGLQFFDRIQLMFMPLKYQPDRSYLRHVPIRKVHLYTLIQFFLCCLLFACTLSTPTALIIPLLFLVVIFTRKGLGYVFHKSHLKLLDGKRPEIMQNKKDDNHEKSSELSNVMCYSDTDSKSLKSHRNSHANINISEVLMQSSIWKCIDQQSQKTSKKILSVKKKKKIDRKKESSKAEECKRLSVMEEEEEEFPNSPERSTSPLPYNAPNTSGINV